MGVHRVFLLFFVVPVKPKNEELLHLQLFFRYAKDMISAAPSCFLQLLWLTSFEIPILNFNVAQTLDCFCFDTGAELNFHVCDLNCINELRVYQQFWQPNCYDCFSRCY